MTYLAGFIVIGVKGFFHSDWLGAGLSASPIGPQLVAGETGKSSSPYPTPLQIYTGGGFGRFS
jgi:hypothetical protein